MKRIYSDQKGFTLIELLVVITILGILAGIIAPRLLGRTEDAKRAAAGVQIRNIEGALKMFRLDNGFYPDTEQGLDALVTLPTVGEIPKKWREGGYLDKVPLDPWDNPYVYISPGSNSPDYDLMSLGADNAIGGDGRNADIESWNLE